MNDFLDHIRADPDDDRLRAVYADWLLEQGDVRGEFISLQLKRARQTSTQEDLRRERELLSTNWYAWSGPLAKALHRDESTFDRGFLTHVAIPRVSTPQKLLAALPGDPHWATVKTLRNVHINRFYAAILRHPVMHRLTRASMDDDELVQLGDAPWKLGELALRAWEIRPEHIQALGEAPFSQLRVLELQTTSLTEVERVEATIEKLTRLDLFLRQPGDARAVVKFLAAARQETVVDTLAWTSRVKNRQVDLTLTDGSPAAIEGAMSVASRVSRAGLKPGSITARVVRARLTQQPPQSWSAPFEAAGFVAQR